MNTAGHRQIQQNQVIISSDRGAATSLRELWDIRGAPFNYKVQVHGYSTKEPEQLLTGWINWVLH